MKKKYKKCYTTGVFDIIHYAHLALFEKCKDIAEEVIVGIQEDEDVFLSKGSYPILSNNERKKTLDFITYIDKTAIYKGSSRDLLNLKKLLKEFKPDVMIQGSDWIKSDNKEEIVDYFKKNNIDLILVPYTKEISSSKIKERIISQRKNKK
jgi:glycerol-3-phosphate cytidylyltransferase